MKTIRKVLAAVVCMAMLFGSVSVFAAEGAPAKATEPTWGDVWDFQEYMDEQLWSHIDWDDVESSGYIFADDEEEQNEYIKRRPAGMIIVRGDLDGIYSDLVQPYYDEDEKNENADYTLHERDDLLTGVFLTNYSAFYDAGIDLLDSLRTATGECYIDDIMDTLLTLEAQYAAFWEKGIIQIEEGDEIPEGEEWIYRSAYVLLEEEHNDIYNNYWPQTDEDWDSLTKAQVQELVTLFTTALNNVDNAKSSGDFRPETPSETPETSEGTVTPQVSDNSITKATGTATIAAAVEAIATTSSVNGVQSTVSGAYLIKKVDGVAFATPLDDIVAGYGLASGEKAYAMVWDLDPKKSYLAQAVIDNTAAAFGAEAGPVVNIELGKRDTAGKYSLLSQDGPAVTIKVGVPASFIQEGKTLAVVRVRPGGTVSILADLDEDPATVTFETTGGAGAYAIVKY